MRCARVLLQQKTRGRALVPITPILCVTGYGYAHNYQNMISYHSKPDPRFFMKES